MKTQIITGIALALSLSSVAFAHGNKGAMHDKCRTDAGVVKGQKPTDEQKAKIQECMKASKEVAKANKAQEPAANSGAATSSEAKPTQTK